LGKELPCSLGRPFGARALLAVAAVTGPGRQQRREKRVQGRFWFSQEEILRLRRLIQLKDAGGPEARGMIRAKLEPMNFYAEDFGPDYDDLTKSQFERLLNTGKVRVLELNDSPTIHGLGRRPNRDPRGTNFKSAYNNIQQRCDTCPGTEVLEPKRPSIRRSDQ
jgi:hypothetical protein